MRDETDIGGPQDRFPATRRSLVLAARSRDPGERTRALEAVISAYWKLDSGRRLSGFALHPRLRTRVLRCLHRAIRPAARSRLEATRRKSGLSTSDAAVPNVEWGYGDAEPGAPGGIRTLSGSRNRTVPNASTSTLGSPSFRPGVLDS
jgi:hypothetical protein